MDIVLKLSQIARFSMEILVKLNVFKISKIQGYPLRVTRAICMKPKYQIAANSVGNNNRLHGCYKISWTQQKIFLRGCLLPIKNSKYHHASCKGYHVFIHFFCICFYECPSMHSCSMEMKFSINNLFGLRTNPGEVQIQMQVPYISTSDINVILRHILI